MSYFLALFSSGDKTIIYLVDGIVVDKEIDKEVNRNNIIVLIINFKIN